MKLGCRHVLSWQIKQIEFQSTKRINFHGHISLRILIHCFDDVCDDSWVSSSRDDVSDLGQ